MSDEPSIHASSFSSVSPEEAGQPLGPPEDGWVIKEPAPDRYIASNDKQTIPRQMWNGIREAISPAILSVATILVIISIGLLTTVELLRRRSDRLRGIKS